MNSKKWIRTWFIITTMIPFVGIFNYLFDPYGFNDFITINKINAKKNSNTTLTTRFKSQILENGHFDTIMIGTSRTGVMNPEVIDKYLGGKTFNLAYPGSVTEIHNRLFLYALKFNDIKNVIYGIDFMSFNKSRVVKNDFQEFYDLHQKIEKREKISNFDLYLNIETFKKSIKLLVKNILGTKKTEVRYLSNGMRDHLNYIEELKNGTYLFEKELHKEIKHYYLPGGIYKRYHFSYQYLEEFREIIIFCKKNNIRLWVYIPPFHSDLFNTLKVSGYYDEFELFKRELVQITDFMDFTGNNSINKSREFYWDGVHLKKEFTDMVISKLLNRSNRVSNFGTLVTKENIEKHLKRVNREINIDTLNKNYLNKIIKKSE
jgi:hypothetical protein